MGMNYYLIRKKSFEEYSYDNPNFKFQKGLENYYVEELKNGFVFDGYYYKDKEELDNHYFERIHIGKSSFGCKFKLCIYNYPCFKATNLKDWKKLFKQYEIRDEDDNSIEPDKMVSIILKRYVSEEYYKDYKNVDYYLRYRKEHIKGEFKTYELTDDPVFW